MSNPKTLLQMAGADPAPAPLSESTLVVIDAQMEYVDGALPLTGVGPAMEALARLIARARSDGGQIVHVVHEGKPGGLFDLDGSGGQVAPEAQPAGNEPIVRKTVPCAFANTDLQERLQGIGRQSLIFAGFMTHMCVSTSARAALNLDYRITVTSDAAATRDLPDPFGGVIAADTVHRASLAALGDRFAAIAPVDEIPS